MPPGNAQISAEDSVAPRTATARTAVRTPSRDVEELPDICARPACRRSYTRTVGPGRPQAFCSEVCRRAAERELRQAKARLSHFEDLVEQIQADIAAFTRPAQASPEAAPEPDRQTLQHAREAIARAGGILTFLANSDDPLARELSALHNAVAPVIATAS